MNKLDESNRYNKKLAQIIISISVILSVIIVIFIFMPSQATGKNQSRQKYFKSIIIESGDSLWSIAEEYMTEEYDNILDYIAELKSMNGLTDDTIHAGNYLVIAYYSDQIK